MALNDEELQLLEAYTDGELTTGEEDALRQRLKNESELAAALESVRAQRETRTAVWKSYEPTPAAVERVIAHVERAVDRHNAWAYRLARWRVPAAAAACILIGFSVGWLGRGKPDLGPSSSDMLVSNSQPTPGVPSPGTVNVATGANLPQPNV